MAETTRFVSKVFIKGTLEAVWREIIKTDELQKAFFNMRLHTKGLEETEGGVEFTLTTEDVVRDSKTAKQMKGGGAMIAKTLKAIIETGRPSFGIRMLYVLFALLALMTPKKCLSENWPV